MLRFSILFLLLLISKPAFTQDNYIALITNPEIGADGNAQNLLAAVDSLNKVTILSHVVVLGNITANGKFDEFIWAQEILDGLTPPYSVVGGTNDYLLSEGRGSEISLLWGEDKSIIANNSFSLVCMNTIIPEFSDREFIDSETLNWLKNEIPNTKTEQVIIFSYHAISSLKNGIHLFSNIDNKKIYSFTAKTDDPTDNNLVTEGFYLNRNDGWGYSLIKIKSDSLFVENISNGDIKKRTTIRIKFNSVNLDLGNDGKTASLKVIWEKNFSKGTITNSIYYNGKILQGFRNGSIVCIEESGDKKWDYQTNGKIYSSPLIEKELLIVATNEGDLLTLNSNTGNLVQVIGIGETITSEICVIDIKEDGSTTKGVVAGTANGNLYCYNLYTLEPLWINQSANNGSGNRIISSIAGRDNKVLFQDMGGTYYCVSAVNGLLLWIWKSPYKNTNPLFKTEVRIKANNIYLVDAAGNFRCIDALLGTEKWSIKNIYAKGLIKDNEKTELYVATKKNKILNISTKLGKVVNEIDLPFEGKDNVITDFILVNDKIITAASDGTVYETKPKQKGKLIFKSSSAPIVSLTNIEGKCLVTDYDGILTLINTTDSK